MSKLKLIPEEILKERLPQLIESDIICDECKRIIKVICFHMHMIQIIMKLFMLQNVQFVKK